MEYRLLFPELSSSTKKLLKSNYPAEKEIIAKKYKKRKNGSWRYFLFLPGAQKMQRLRRTRGEGGPKTSDECVNNEISRSPKICCV